MKMVIYMKIVLFGILPGIIYGLLFLLWHFKLTKRKLLLLLFLLILGAIGSWICYRLEMHFGSYFKKVKDSNYFEILFYAIFGVAIFEEGYKWLITVGTSLLSKKIFISDWILFSVFSALGFATFENVVFYAIPYGISTISSRFFTAFLSHICNAIWMGVFLYLFQRKKKRYLFLFSFLIPILLHAIYNSFLYGGHKELYIYYKFFCVIYFFISILLIIMLKKRTMHNDA